MAITVVTGSFSGASSTPSTDFLNMLGTQFASFGGNWSVVDNNLTTGTTVRTVIKNTAGFSVMFNRSTSPTTNTGLIFSLGKDYYTTNRQFTITAATSTGSGSSFVYTYTTSVNHNIMIGERVTISGITGTNTGNFNRTNAIVIDTPASNTFQIAFTATATNATAQSATAQLNPIGTITGSTTGTGTITYTYTQTNGYDFKINDTVTIGYLSGGGTAAANATVIAATPTTVTINTPAGSELWENATLISRRFLTVNTANTLIDTAFSRISTGGATSNSLGFSGANYNPTTFITASTLGAQYTLTNSQTSWIIVYSDTYAIIGFNDGTTQRGKWLYLGEAESLVANPDLPDLYPFVLVYSTISGGDSTHRGGGQILQSLGNESINIFHGGYVSPEVDPTNIGAPGIGSYRDKYAEDPLKTNASPIIVTRATRDIKSAEEASSYGWLRFRLYDILFTHATGSSWGDTTNINGSDYQIIGGTNITTDSGGGISGWVRIN
jgi:hypothetical protein